MLPTESTPAVGTPLGTTGLAGPLSRATDSARRIVLLGGGSLVALSLTLGVYYLLSTRADRERHLASRGIQSARLAMAVAALRQNAVRRYVVTGDSVRLLEARAYQRAIATRLDTLAALATDSATAATVRESREAVAELERGWVAEALRTPWTPLTPTALQRLLSADERPMRRVRRAFEDMTANYQEQAAGAAARHRRILGGGVLLVLIELALIAALLWRSERSRLQQTRDLAEAYSKLQDQQVELEMQTEEAQVLTEELEQTNQDLVDALQAADRARNDAVESAKESAASLALLDAALASAPVGLAFYDEDLRYRHVNPRLAEMVGLPAERMIGRTLEEILPEFGPQLTPIMREVQMAGQATTSIVVRGQTPAQPGVEREWLVSYYPVRMNGSLPGVGVVATEMTEQRNLEAQLRQAQKMEAVGRLAGGVAHDFNNLLTVILAHAALARELVDAATQRELLDDLVEIEQAARRAATLTSQLLAFSRQQVIQPREVDLNETVHNLEKMLRRLIGEDIELVTDLEPDLWPVLADPGYLDQILMNLAVNSRDAMTNGGILRIRTRSAVRPPIAAGAHEHELGDYVMLEVSDNGTGMDEQTQQRVFEPFFTTKPKGQGTGLGLSTVYGIVQQSGGHITLESAPGEGTTFRVYLPRATSQPTEAVEMPSAAGKEGRAETILVVEDEDAVRGLLERVLSRHGYRVLTAGNITEARLVAEALEGPLDLVITDMVMPGGNGRDVREAVAGLHPDARVLYMSGYTEDDITRRGLGGAESAFLQKPFTAQNLLERIREILDAPPGKTGEFLASAG